MLLIFSCIVQIAFTQNEIHLDSIQSSKKEPENKALKMEMPLQFDQLFPNEEFSLFDNSIFKQSLFPDYSKNLDFIKYLKPTGFSVESFSVRENFFSPFYAAENIFNRAIYKVSDHFSFGGNSFGAQSIFDQPKLNPSINEMGIKGASMFLQYKFSDKFKVQTRVSISNNRSPWEP